MEEAAFTEADSASPKSWPDQDANLSPENLLVQIQVSEKGPEGEPATSAEGHSLGKSSKAGHATLFTSPAHQYVHCLSCFSRTKVSFIPKKTKPVCLAAFPSGHSSGPQPSADADGSHFLPPTRGQT